MPATKAEDKLMHHEVGRWGMKLWNVFNNLKNSSTRCEIGAAVVAMAPPTAVNIGIDSSATTTKGTAVVEHQKKRMQSTLGWEDGTLELGENLSPLHRESPWKRPW